MFTTSGARRRVRLFDRGVFGTGISLGIKYPRGLRKQYCNNIIYVILYRRYVFNIVSDKSLQSTMVVSLSLEQNMLVFNTRVVREGSERLISRKRKIK